MSILDNPEPPTYKLPTRINVLDHGFVQLVESWGSDARVIEAARMSTQKGFEGWGPFDCPECGHLPVTERINLQGTPLGKQGCTKCRGRGYVEGDEKLLAYLYNNRHETPFEMAGMIIEVQAPIFVFREWHRHRVQGYNEASARYAPLPAIDYVPTRERVMMGGGHLTKQAGGVAEGLTAELADEWLMRLQVKYETDEAFYQWGLSIGVPKELARIGMPVGHYSKMRATCNLRNWLGFMTLRADKKAQFEIQEFARAVSKIIEELFPRTHGLWAVGK